MNKIYSKVWNQDLNTWVVASELAHSRGKGNGPSSSGTGLLRGFGAMHESVLARKLSLCIGVLSSVGLMLHAPIVSANTVGAGATYTQMTCNFAASSAASTLEGVARPAQAQATDGSGTYSLVTGCNANAGGSANGYITVYGNFAVT